jgi:hypothetical protein
MARANQTEHVTDHKNENITPEVPRPQLDEPRLHQVETDPNLNTQTVFGKIMARANQTEHVTEHSSNKNITPEGPRPLQKDSHQP